MEELRRMKLIGIKLNKINLGNEEIEILGNVDAWRINLQENNINKRILKFKNNKNM